MNFDKNEEFNNLFGEEKDVFKNSDNPLQFHPGDTNVTPNILLEQLAYVDNFMPDFEGDLASFGGPAHGTSDMPSAGLGLDERLAAELSAFADETFIFPDEDKPVDAGDNGADNDDNDNRNNAFDRPSHNDADRGPEASSSASASASASASNQNLHGLTNGERDLSRPDASDLSSFQNRSSKFLSQRRNNFLASQHDTRLRFSSKNRQRETTRSPAEDHGGFTNVDITEGPSHQNGQQGLAYINSPLNNLLSDSNPQTVEMISNGSNTPSFPSQAYRQTGNFPLENHREPSPESRVPSHIHMPNYSSIPTRTLLTLLPKARVPTGARNALTAAGLQSEEIDSIAAIMAYHQLNNNSDFSSDLSLAAIRNLLSNEVGANFLLPFLTGDNQPAQMNELSSAASTRVESAAKASSNSPVNDRNIGNPADKLLCNFFNIDGGKTSANLNETGTNRGNSTSHTPRHSITSSAVENEPVVSGQEQKITKQPNRERSDSSVSLTEKRTKTNPKRKLKEQEMEGSIQELSELALNLQQRIQTLEMENRLLKNLVTERGELTGVEEVENVRRELLRKIKEDNSRGPVKKE
ncbi:LAFA_0C06480g1_1 [Lachancea sp. 'fantastica']|nr:LAFA_0C06480g1_1 [Lachancea sp. 'fantastica']